MLNMYRWMWKHRCAWKELKQLRDNRTELRQFLREIDAALNDGTAAPATLERLSKQAKHHHEWLRELDRLPLARDWKLEPPSAPPPPAVEVGYSKGADGWTEFRRDLRKRVYLDQGSNGTVLRIKPWPDPPPSKRPVDSAYLKTKDAEYWTGRIKAFNRGEI